MDNDEKRSQLLFAKGELRVGRRESVAPDAEKNAKHRRMIYARGFALGAVVVIAVIVLLVILGSNIAV